MGIFRSKTRYPHKSSICLDDLCAVVYQMRCVPYSPACEQCESCRQPQCPRFSKLMQMRVWGLPIYTPFHDDQTPKIYFPKTSYYISPPPPPSTSFLRTRPYPRTHPTCRQQRCLRIMSALPKETRFSRLLLQHPLPPSPNHLSLLPLEYRHPRLSSTLALRTRLHRSPKGTTSRESYGRQ